MRQEALALSSHAAKLTPLAKIAMDQRFVEQFSGEELNENPIPAIQPAIQPIKTTVGSWLFLLGACALVTTFVCHGSITEIWTATIGMLFLATLFQQPPQASLLPLYYVNWFVLLVVPSLLSAFLAPHLIFIPRDEQFRTTMASGRINYPPETRLQRLLQRILCVATNMALLLALANVLNPVGNSVNYHSNHLGDFLLASLGWVSILMTLTFLSHSASIIKDQLRTRQVLAKFAPLKEEETASVSMEEILSRTLRKITAREHLIADHSPELILALDENWQILECNLASLKLLGFLPQELQNRNLKSLNSSEHSASTVYTEVTRQRTKNEVKHDLCCVSKQGTMVDLSCSFEWSERRQAYFMVAKDISAEKRIERARSQFLSMISHEVRSPLLAVLMALRSMADGHYGDIEPEARDAALRAERNVLKIIEMVGELIDLEKSVDAVLVPNIAVHTLDDLTEKALEQTLEIAQHLKVSVLNKTSSLPIECDRTRIIRTLVNLVTNAIKYSGKGGIVEISCETKFQAIEVRVKDNGPGIPDHLQTVIFDRFYQIPAEGAKGGSLPSSGLGLAICKVHVEAHGGHIGVRSTPGAGSTFWFTIPLQSA